GRYNDSNGAYSAVLMSPDLVEEVQISVNTVDSSLGRGSAQVQVRTRAGGNAFHGALFYTNNNSKLNANNWFDNLTGQEKSYQNRNQFGGRLGGPIKKNKAFFFVLIDQRVISKSRRSLPWYSRKTRVTASSATSPPELRAASRGEMAMPWPRPTPARWIWAGTF